MYTNWDKLFINSRNIIQDEDALDGFIMVNLPEMVDSVNIKVKT